MYLGVQGKGWGIAVRCGQREVQISWVVWVEAEQWFGEKDESGVAHRRQVWLECVMNPLTGEGIGWWSDEGTWVSSAASQRELVGVLGGHNA